MDDAKLSVWIEILTKEVGAQKAREILDQYKVAAGSAGEATKEFSNKTDKATDATEQFNIKGRAQFLLFGELNRIVPGLGSVLHAAFAGPLGPIILAGIAIAEVTNYIKEQNAELDKQGELAANPDFLDAIEARLKVFRDAASAQQAFADSITNAATSQDTLSNKLKDQLSLLQAIERAQAALTSAQKELDIAKIQEDETSGRKTPEQAAEARAAVEKKYLEKAQSDKEAAARKDMDTRVNAMLQMHALQTDLDKKALAMRQKVTAAEAHSESVKIDPRDILNKKNDAQKQLDKAQEKLDDETDNARAYSGEQVKLSGLDPNSEQGKALFDKEFSDYTRPEQDAVDKAKGKISALQKQLRQYGQDQANQPQRDEDKRLLADAEARAKKNAEEVAQLQDQIAADQEKNSATLPIDRQTVQTKEQTVDEKEKSRVSQDVSKDFDIIARVAREAAPSREQKQQASTALADINTAFESYHGVVVGSLKNLHTNIKTLTTAVHEIQAHQSHPGL